MFSLAHTNKNVLHSSAAKNKSTGPGLADLKQPFQSLYKAKSWKLGNRSSEINTNRRSNRYSKMDGNRHGGNQFEVLMDDDGSDHSYSPKPSKPPPTY